MKVAPDCPPRSCPETPQIHGSPAGKRLAWLCPTLAHSCSSGSMNLATSSQKGPRQQHLHHVVNPKELSCSADWGMGRQKSNCCLFSLASSFPSFPSSSLPFLPLSRPLFCLLGAVVQTGGKGNIMFSFVLSALHLKYLSSNYPWIRLCGRKETTGL